MLLRPHLRIGANDPEGQQKVPHVPVLPLCDLLA
jgi:hypothetical protein